MEPQWHTVHFNLIKEVRELLNTASLHVKCSHHCCFKLHATRHTNAGQVHVGDESHTSLVQKEPSVCWQVHLFDLHLSGVTDAHEAAFYGVT